jgi:hypothetical protein
MHDRKSFYENLTKAFHGEEPVGKTTVGNRVVYSKWGRSFRGKVEDEVSLLEEYEDQDFLDLIQHIRWDDGSHSIRFCYYVRDHGSEDQGWIFANRPLSTSPDRLEELLRLATKKKWFMKLH